MSLINNKNIYFLKTKGFYVFVSSIIVLTFSSFIKIDLNQSSKKFVVVLDAGHGGKDPGNLGNGFKEKDIALKIALEVGEILEKNPNIKVVYTRKTDVFIELIDRPKIANNADADLFVSIHCDSHTSQAYGAGTFVMSISKISQNLRVAKQENSVIFLEDNYQEKYSGFDPNSPESIIGSSIAVEEYLDQSILAASLIQKNLVNNLNRKDRKVKQDVFWVLHATVMPSVLVETGFLTNKSEGSYLNSKTGQIEMATQIAQGILDYKKRIDNITGDFNIVDQIDNSVQEKEVSESNTNAIIFKIQIAASASELDTKPYNFKGLQNISRIKQGGLYKYFYGSTNNYKDTKLLEDEAKRKGYNSCFVVAFKDGEKIDLSEALKSTTN